MMSARRGRPHALASLLATGALLALATAARAGDPVRRVGAQPDSLARHEAAYARAVASIGDSAIRQLDFFPARAQLRVQTAFLDPARAAAVPFEEIAARSAAADEVIASLALRLGDLAPPEDLTTLHGALAAALRDAQIALTRLRETSEACRTLATSVVRCQSPFTTASSMVAQSYRRYLEARGRIGSQIRDTGTELPPFGRATP